jgi:hypothetical protein
MSQSASAGLFFHLCTLKYLSGLFTQTSELVYLDENIVPFFCVKFTHSDVLS